MIKYCLWDAPKKNNDHYHFRGVLFCIRYLCHYLTGYTRWSWLLIRNCAHMIQIKRMNILLEVLQCIWITALQSAESSLLQFALSCTTMIRISIYTYENETYNILKDILTFWLWPSFLFPMFRTILLTNAPCMQENTLQYKQQLTSKLRLIPLANYSCQNVIQCNLSNYMPQMLSKVTGLILIRS